MEGEEGQFEHESEHESKQKLEEETFVAVKVVSALGNLAEYQCQVNALQKKCNELEYGNELGGTSTVIN